MRGKKRFRRGLNFLRPNGCVAGECAATQIVSSMVGAVSALEPASRNLDEAPERIRNLEEFLCELESLTRQVKQENVYKLHNH